MDFRIFLWSVALACILLAQHRIFAKRSVHFEVLTAAEADSMAKSAFRM